MTPSSPRSTDRRRAAALAAALALAAGCRGETPPPSAEAFDVRGRVTRQGGPVAGHLDVQFVRTDGSGACAAYYDAHTGGYETRRTTEAGDYRVEVRQPGPDGKDRLKGAYGPGRTPFALTVAGDRVFDLDLK